MRFRFSPPPRFSRGHLARRRREHIRTHIIHIPARTSVVFRTRVWARRRPRARRPRAAARRAGSPRAPAARDPPPRPSAKDCHPEVTSARLPSREPRWCRGARRAAACRRATSSGTTAPRGRSVASDDAIHRRSPRGAARRRRRCAPSPASSSRTPRARSPRASRTTPRPSTRSREPWRASPKGAQRTRATNKDEAAFLLLRATRKNDRLARVAISTPGDKRAKRSSPPPRARRRRWRGGASATASSSLCSSVPRRTPRDASRTRTIRTRVPGRSRRRRRRW